MFKKLLAAAIIAASAVNAQDGPTVEFNVLEIEGFELSDIFNFDDGYTEETGQQVPVPFRLLVPRADGVELIADGQPDGGIVKFTFVTETEPRQFIENLRIFTATVWPEVAPEDFEQARIEAASMLMQEQAFPMATGQFQHQEVLALGGLQVGDHIVAELVGRYLDPTIGPMLIRMVMFMDPESEQAYLFIANLNWAHVPATSPEDLANSLTGRTMLSFEWLE